MWVALRGVSDVWDSWGGVLTASAVGVPLVLLVVAVSARRHRQRGDETAHAWRTAAAEVCAVAGTLPWVWMILTPADGDREVRLVPLVDLADLFGSDWSTVVVQLVGNLLVFAAAGFCLPIRFRIGPAGVAALAAAGSLTVETLQYGLDIGRVSSIDDVLLNSAGAVLAALASRRWWAARIRTASMTNKV